MSLYGVITILYGHFYVVQTQFMPMGRVTACFNLMTIIIFTHIAGLWDPKQSVSKGNLNNTER